MANKKSQNVSASEDEEGTENGVAEVVSKPAAKGRGRPKKAPGTTKAEIKGRKQAAAGGVKKGRGRPKQQAATEVESAEDEAASAEEENEEPVAKKAKAAPSPKKPAAAATKGRGRPKKV